MDYWLGYLTLTVIFLSFAVPLNILAGYTGVFSVASTGFGALGGYIAAYLTSLAGWDFGAVLTLALGVGAVVGLLISFPVVRLPEEYVILLTLAFSALIVSIITASPFFGGQLGLIGLPLPGLFGWRPYSALETFLFFSVLAGLMVAVCWRLGESPFGRLLRAIKGDELATRSLGKQTTMIKLGTFAAMSAFSAVGGVLLVSYYSVASPTLFSFDQTMLIFAMVIIGGLGSIPGTILGTLVIVMSEPVLIMLLSFDQQVAAIIRPILFGILIILVLRFRPGGIIQRRRQGLPPHREVTAIVPLGEGEVARTPPALLLVVESVYKRFGGVKAVNDLSLLLAPGRITALLGPNGAGKSTVFNLVTGALTPDAGQVLLDREPLTGSSPEKVARKGVVRSFQDVRVFGDLSALENVMVSDQRNPGENPFITLFLPRRVARHERRARARAIGWLQFVGVEDMHRPADSLSFAQQKLVAIARVLATDAEILLLDEPLSGLEGRSAEHILEVLERIRELGRTVCIVEHNVAAVRRLADHAFFMEQGTVTAAGTVAELLADPRLEEAYFGAH
ncbi:branched-chain amino acid ABC transporter ATP-binding protein/permease [Microbacterium sp. CPCC 204701]|uniref:branched-chain amino acid ABC transporter ATP-binding protein/permease n=1 Tax=Microbacterium sp. CPCC 204701 TaxID=2493084 RepID=UPI000FDB26DB|nr:ATP-binding cassette domain-containing protein [Microbacterium sp. CPCC 204701]